MQKEYQIQQEIYQPLLGKLNGKPLDKDFSGMSRIIKDLCSGQMPTGLTLNQLEQSTNKSQWEKILYRFAPAIALVTDPQISLIPEQLTIAGGWCAIRTNEVKELQSGIIVEPETNKLTKIISVKQVANWIKTSVSFDQITEAIAPLSQVELMAISEVRLWSERICQKLSWVLPDPLTSTDKDQIFKAVEEADKKRYQLTQRYISYVTDNPQREADLKRILDYQIWPELTTARDELIQAAGLSLEQLAAMYQTNVTWIDSMSLVWTMYSQPYFQVLKQGGYIQGEQFLIAEPAEHAQPASAVEAYFTNRIYQKFNRLGVYFYPEGINANTGYVAFIGCIDSRGQNARKNLSLGEIPNLSNWEKMLTGGQLSPENNLSINIQENKLLLWALNLMPFESEVQESIIALTKIRQEFNETKKKTNGEIKGKEAQAFVSGLKQKLEPEIFAVNQKLASSLFLFFQYLTQ